MKKKTALLLVMAITLAGCGSNADSGTTDKSADKAEGTTEGAASETAGLQIVSKSEAVSDGVLTVGTNAEFPPFEFVGDDGEPDGFDIALVKAIGDKLGVEVEVENMEFNELVASVGTKIDVAIAGMTITEERKNMVDFSSPYYQAVQYVIVPADAEVTGIPDLEGKSIGVQLGTTGDFLAAEINGVNISQYSKAADAVDDLMNDRIDAVIIDKNPALVFAEKFGEKVKALDGAQFRFEVEEYAIATPKEDDVLVEDINSALEGIIEDGTFDKLVTEYIGN